MISNTHKTVNTLLSLAASLAFCTGVSYSSSAQAETGATSQIRLSSSTTAYSKAQIHVPWKMLSERLKSLVNQEASGVAQPIEGQSIEAGGITWQLSSGSAKAALSLDTATVSEAQVALALRKAVLQIDLDQITVDQLVERVVGGVRVRVRLNAVCGPIQIQQADAKASSTFSLNWTTGSPVATLANLDLGWEPNSWTFNDFECTGPSGLDTELREGISNYLRDPATFKLYVERYIAENLKTQVDAVLAQLRTPLKVGTGSEAVSLSVGALAPVSTGVIADITLTRAGKTLPAPAPSKSLPDEKSLSKLATSSPSLIGDLDLVEFAIQQKLRSQGQYYRVDLQLIEGFRKLMKNRIAQLFKWAELMNYPSSSPFYLNFAVPKSLSLKRGTGSSLTSSVPVYAVSQSYRDKQWWTWIETKGSAKTNVALSVSNGRLTYSTTIESVSIKSNYAKAYAKRFDKDSGNHIPDDIISEAIAGPQSALSGQFAFPDLDLGAAGEYRADALEWLDSKSFRLTFSRQR